MKRILVVDDEENVAFFLSETLAELGLEYHVETACCGEDALKKVAVEPFSLLITDLRMPGMSGLELIRQVRKLSPRTRTILITAYGDDEVEAEARSLGVYDYITKPFQIDEFTQMVQKALLRDMLVPQIFHELRMPLTYILSYADILVEQSEGSHHEWAQQILDQALRMREALEEFTLLTEWNTSQMPGYLRPVDLSQVLETTAALVSSSVVEKKQVLQIAPTSEPIRINTDPWLLGALLTALVSHAIKHAPVQGRIHVAVNQNGDRNTVITIREDTNGAAVERPAPESPTVSLNVARGLIEALGGQLDIQSNGGNGAISRVILSNTVCTPEKGSGCLGVMSSPPPAR
jgi:CheY-like chemotaxis protein/two-component sensor histidine kinase